MPETILTCPQCRASWPSDPASLSALNHCPTCSCPVQIEIFPAFTRPVAVGSIGEAVVLEGEAACFYHPQKRATVPCGICGRFLCALCDLELNGQHVCPNCLDSGRKKGQLEHLETRRTVYDTAALTLASLGFISVCTVIFFWVAIPLAPLAIGVAIYGWRKPGSIVSRTRLRAVLAIVLAALELIGIVAVIYSFSTKS